MKPKISVVILNDAISTVGGAITAFYNITDILAKENDVTAFYYGRKTDCQDKILDNGVELINLYNPHNKDLKQIFKAMINEINPEILIFFYPRDVKKLMNKGDFGSIKKILLNRSRPDFYKDYSQIKEIIKDFDALQVFFDSYKKLCKPYYQGYITTIENSIANRKNKVDLSNEKKNIIYLSRIDVWKGADILIEAFKKVVLKYPDWRVQIYGNIEPKQYAKHLQNLIVRYNLQKNVFLMGVTQNIEKAFLGADFCVFPSYFEGFPNGLAEAQSYGLPSVGFNGCSGVNELIIDGYNGMLVEDNADDLAGAMISMIENKEQRMRMGNNTLLSNKKYSQAIIEQKWQKLICDVTGNNVIRSDIKELESDVYIFPMYKIQEMKFQQTVLSFWKRMFSLNFTDRKMIIYILGLRIEGRL